MPVPADGPYDAVASIEMSEHVGQEQYPATRRRCTGWSRPGGRVLVLQAMSHPSAPAAARSSSATSPRTCTCGRSWETAAMLARPGLELRDVESLRSTTPGPCAPGRETLERRWDEVVGLIGEPGARIWRLYLAGGALDLRGEPDGRRPAPRSSGRTTRVPAACRPPAAAGRSPEHGLGAPSASTPRSRLAAVWALLSGTWLVALRVGRHAVVDVVWGSGFVVVAAVSALLARAHGVGDGGRGCSSSS